MDTLDIYSAMRNVPRLEVFFPQIFCVLMR